VFGLSIVSPPRIRSSDQSTVAPRRYSASLARITIGRPPSYWTRSSAAAASSGFSDML
jgi:hypothetical protein